MGLLKEYFLNNLSEKELVEYAEMYYICQTKEEEYEQHQRLIQEGTTTEG
jgi:hypothetical protein